MNKPKNYQTHSIIAVAILGISTLTSQAQESFQAKYAQLSPAEKAATKAEATQKEDYDQMPAAPKKLTDQSTAEFCKTLPRGLETVIPENLAVKGEVGIERQRTLIWARRLSCYDSVLYYEGHRFFKSGHYTEAQIRSAITEINKVMKWLAGQEDELYAKQTGLANVR